MKVVKWKKSKTFCNWNLKSNIYGISTKDLKQFVYIQIFLNAKQ
jgi:hypothetical protein